MVNGEEMTFSQSGHARDASDGAVREYSTIVELKTTAVLSAWGCSLLIHAAMFLGMFALVFPYAPMVETQSPVIRAAFVGEVLPLESATMTASLWSATEASTNSPIDRAPRDSQFAPRGSETPSDRPLPLGGRMTPEPEGWSVVGIGGSGIAGAGTDFNEAGWSMGGGGRADFFGLGRTVTGVQRIVYVVDKSGSMTDSFDFVRVELKRSIGALKRSQKFHVIFYSDGEPLENPPRTLVSAIAAQKEQSFKFLAEVMPGGSTHPEGAMRRALDLEPDLVYFLTDGEFDKSLMGKLEEWNKDRRTRICTVAFFGADGAPLLEQIAREHGGEFRSVSEHDLP